MKVWVISDTHGKHPYLDIPGDVDMLIHAGDLGNVRDPILNSKTVISTLEWIESLAHIKYKIVIAGNHDTSIYNKLVRPKEYPSLVYLEHDFIVIEGIKIFGSPYTPTFGQGWAFNIERSKLDRYWQEIPGDVDVLVTHGPPLGILDHTESGIKHTDQYGSRAVMSCGDSALRKRVFEIKPKYHIFGHIHPEERCFNHGTYECGDTKFINASVLDLSYSIHNDGIIIEIT